MRSKENNVQWLGLAVPLGAAASLFSPGFWRSVAIDECTPSSFTIHVVLGRKSVKKQVLWSGLHFRRKYPVPTVQRACIRKTRAKKGLDANHTKKGLAARPLHGRYAGCKKKKEARQESTLAPRHRAGAGTITS
jgi:hypothetical protein